jgi:hypothetical protein
MPVNTPKRPGPIRLDLPHSAAVNLPVAAYGAGVAPDCMRAWLKSGSVRLLVPRRAAGKWLRVSPVDCVRLAILGHLLRFGATIAEANGVIIDSVDRHLEGIALSVGDVPWPQIASALRGHSLAVSRDHDGLVVAYQTMFGGRPAKHNRRAALLTLEIGWIAAEVRERVKYQIGEPR